MTTTEQILVIILSSFLGLFLLLGIVVLVRVVQLVNKLNVIAEAANDIVSKAHDIADKVDTVSDMFKKSAGPLALGKYLMNVAEMVAKHKKGK